MKQLLKEAPWTFIISSNGV